MYRIKDRKGEIHPKMITSHLVVFVTLSRMVMVQGACRKPFWIYKRLDNCAACAPNCDDVLMHSRGGSVLCAGYAKEATTKM